MSVKLASELQSGNVIIVENVPVIVLKAQLNKSGRNQAVVKVKTKNLLTGRISELIFKSDDKLEGVMMEKKECTYSYYAPPAHVFVDSEFNQYEGRPISVVLPKIIIREVEYTEPVVRGDTSGKITKSAILKETKHELQVTQFVEIGDKIEIDTETGEFRRRCI